MRKFDVLLVPPARQAREVDPELVPQTPAWAGDKTFFEQLICRQVFCQVLFNSLWLASLICALPNSGV